jgi:hypothetical protein
MGTRAKWRSIGSALAVSAACVIAGCGADTPDDGSTGNAEVVASDRQLVIAEDITVLAEHPDTLRELEARGLDLGSRLVGAKLANNAGFAASPEGASLIAAVEKDVADVRQQDKLAGVGMQFDHRAFDASWLRSKEGSFQLVAVANRMDRRHANPDACGEIHLVYRLGYTNKIATSRLPMTLMVVYPQPKGEGGCSEVASRWLSLSGSTPAEKADALTRGPHVSVGTGQAGPLSNLPLAPKVEMNFQLVRWPSATRKDMGGHAEYSLRVFARGDGKLAPVKLDNTLRTDLDADETAKLASWVAENLPAIDHGTAQLPAAFLAERAISVSPKGLARAQNRPYAIALGKDGAGLGDLPLDGLSLVRSKAALVRRLDTMSCNGCHQSQGIAGFHVVGHDRLEQTPSNALVEGISAHTREQLAFRKADLTQLGASKDKTAELAPLPFAERAEGRSPFALDGRYGAACGLGDPGFAKWTCAPGLTCADVDGDDVGICVTGGKTRKIGEACEAARVTFSADPHADKVEDMTTTACSLPNGAGGHCVRSDGGFPNGMCGGSCAKVGKVDGGAICAPGVPTGFNECIAKLQPFEGCSQDGKPAYRLACNAGTPCGPDYVCSVVPGAPPGTGACIPPYFVFQVRVDGHLVGN